jgi:hypothetical protein
VRAENDVVVVQLARAVQMGPRSAAVALENRVAVTRLALTRVS